MSSPSAQTCCAPAQTAPPPATAAQSPSPAPTCCDTAPAAAPTSCCDSTPTTTSSCCGDSEQDDPPSPWRIRAGVAAAALGATALITVADPAWTAALAALGLDVDSTVGSVAHFALYESGKILALISSLVFLVGMLGTWLTPARVQQLLSRRRRVVGHALAAGLGAVTPFCSCSSVPLYVGMNRAGVPVGVGMTFLVASPLVNEIALGLLASMVGPGVALAYLALGLGIALLTGALVGAMTGRGAPPAPVMLPLADTGPRPTFDDRLLAGAREARTTLRKLWPFVALAIALGAVVHGWVPTELIARIGDQWWGVPAAVLVGIPLYSATATAIPLLAPLHAAGVPLGTLIAMIMAVVGLSAPELLMLRKVMDRRTLVTFVSVVATGIIGAGYLINLLA